MKIVGDGVIVHSQRERYRVDHQFQPIKTLGVFQGSRDTGNMASLVNTQSH